MMSVSSPQLESQVLGFLAVDLDEAVQALEMRAGEGGAGRTFVLTPSAVHIVGNVCFIHGTQRGVWWRRLSVNMAGGYLGKKRLVE
jgi:hypothetical protein